MSRYLTVEEVAERLKVSVSWVYRHKDLLGAVRLGDRLWRFPEQELTARLAGQAVPSPQAAAGNGSPAGSGRGHGLPRAAGTSPDHWPSPRTAGQPRRRWPASRQRRAGGAEGRTARACLAATPG